MQEFVCVEAGVVVFMRCIGQSSFLYGASVLGVPVSIPSSQ